MFRKTPLFILLLAAAAAQQKPPEFKPGPDVPAMPKALMKLPRTEITRAKFPTVDFHFHGRTLRTAQDYQKLIQLMDQTNLAVISNMDGGFGDTFDEAMKIGEPYKDRISGNDPGQRFPYTFPGVGATGFWGKFLPIAVSPAYKVDNVMPYTEHYNFNIQRQIGSTTVLTLAYVGSQGHHLLANLPFNPGSPASK